MKHLKNYFSQGRIISEGVALFMNQMRGEFERAMVMTGVSSVSKIDGNIVSITT